MKTLFFAFAAACSLGFAEIVTIKTSQGEIVVEVDVEHAPLTAKNFLEHVRAQHYNDAKFYRVARNDEQNSNPVPITIVQGGVGIELASSFAPIVHETTATTGITHRHGTISMARLAPGSATTEFFICIDDQPELDFGGARNPDGQGFAAFGRVVDGLDIIKSVSEQPTLNQILVDPLRIISMTENL